MKKIVLAIALFLLFAIPALATEYWGGYDNSSGDRVTVIVSYGETLSEGSSITVQNESKGSQVETTAFSVTVDGDSARIDAMIDGERKTFNLSR